MSPVIAPDVSEFQVPVDDTFDREWLIFRLCFNGRIDTHAAHNLAWAIKASADGRIKGFTGYVVPLPGGTDACMASLEQIGWPHGAPVMIDAEKWNGQPYQINGDHSVEFNSLAERLRKRQGDNPKLVWAYGNRGPDLEVWPHKASWLGWVVAGYTAGAAVDPPLPPNAIGWQYTDGEPQYDNPARPHSTPPFGRCDHNALYTLPEGEAEMALTDDDAEKVVNHLMQRALFKDGTTFKQAIQQIRAQSDPAKLAAAVVGKLPKTSTALTEADIEAAVRAVFADAGDGK